MHRATLTALVTALLAGSMAVSAELQGPTGQSQGSTRDDPPAPTFKRDIAPLLKSNCAPCHFKGGAVVERYPFEDYETVRKLGLRLNSRLKGAKADLVTRWVQAKSPE